mmetsp:Transcript_70274/g.199290  ORF Transcript_70274/g.199290 Transcript_70274/m.199290 type:complete len:141 (+) Transcript_70274:58-480(+)
MAVFPVGLARSGQLQHHLPHDTGVVHNPASFQSSRELALEYAIPKPKICYHYPGEDPSAKVRRPPSPDHGLHRADIPDVVLAARLGRMARLARFFGGGVMVGGASATAFFARRACCPADGEDEGEGQAAGSEPASASGTA